MTFYEVILKSFLIITNIKRQEEKLVSENKNEQRQDIRPKALQNISFHGLLMRTDERIEEKTNFPVSRPQAMSVFSPEKSRLNLQTKENPYVIKPIK
jgi:hypothetical protein